MRSRKNSGFSMVELIVTIAIMAILIGTAGLSYMIVNKSNVKKAAETIDDCFTLCREKAMTNSAEEWNVTIKSGKVEVRKLTLDDDNNIQTEVVETRSLPSKVNIYITEPGTANEIYISGDEGDKESVSVSFKLLSGEVGKIYFDGNRDGEYMYPSSGSTSTGCRIVVDYKNKKSYCIELYYSTGRHIVEEMSIEK